MDSKIRHFTKLTKYNQFRIYRRQLTNIIGPFKVLLRTTMQLQHWIQVYRGQYEHTSTTCFGHVSAKGKQYADLKYRSVLQRYSSAVIDSILNNLLEKIEIRMQWRRDKVKLSKWYRLYWGSGHSRWTIQVKRYCHLQRTGKFKDQL